MECVDINNEILQDASHEIPVKECVNNKEYLDSSNEIHQDKAQAIQQSIDEKFSHELDFDGNIDMDEVISFGFDKLNHYLTTLLHELESSFNDKK